MHEGSERLALLPSKEITELECLINNNLIFDIIISFR